MKVLVIGAGGVGTAFARIASHRNSFDHIVMADYDRARATGPWPGSPRLRRRADRRLRRNIGGRADQGDRVDAVLNAVDPRFVMPIFRGHSRRASPTSTWPCRSPTPTPSAPYEETGVKLGDEQFELSSEWEKRGLLALAGIGVEPGLSDIFARYAADSLFTSIEEVGVRDGANLVVEGYDFGPTFSIWTTIEECLNPPVIWERERGWFTTEPFSEPETFVFPEGIGPVECVNVEHEEVLLVRVGSTPTGSPSSTGSGTSSSGC